MKLIVLTALTLSLNAFAGEKCRSQAAKQLPAGSSLLPHAAVILAPGADYPYMMGEVWNDTNETLEFYGVSKSNGYYDEYTAVGTSLKDCKVKRVITIGDSLE